VTEAADGKTVPHPGALSPLGLHKALARNWDTPPGLQRLSAVNHNILGRRFMITALVFFAIGGILAMLIRAQLATGHSAFVGPELYGQIFTMHGTVMMFLFAIPVFEGFAIYMLPKLLGGRDLAFPRLGAYGYWCYLFGGTILIVAMLLGLAPDGGWFMYTPLSSRPYSPGVNADVWLLGITFVEISAVTAAVEIMVTVLKLRAPGMSLDRMPIFAWYMLVTAGMMLIGFPPLILGSILLELERAAGLPFFDPARGGDPLLWQHLFWLFGHPEVYIIFLPAAGAFSTMIPVFAQRPLIGYRAVVVAIVAMAFLSFGLWVHHMYTVGIPHLSLAFFSAASALVAIPTAVQLFSWLATLAHGRPRMDIPMLYVFGFLVVFVIGGLTGVMLAMVPFDTQAHDSHFVVAHLHYVLVGGFVFPMLAAIYYWMPHFTGRQPIYRMSKPAFWLILIGFNLTFFMMHLTGLLGMPRRVHTYSPEYGWEWLNLLSSVGGFVLTIGFALVLLDIVLQVRFGKRFRRNPWQAPTLEWLMPTPPASYNFASLPQVTGRTDKPGHESLGPSLAAGKGWLGFARSDWQETLGVDMTSGAIEQVVLLPSRSFTPFYAGLATCAFFLALLFKVYWLAPFALVAVIAAFIAWGHTLGLREDLAPLDVGHGLTAPPQAQLPQAAPGFWGSVFAIAGNATLYASLLFGALFLVLVAPSWPPPDLGPDLKLLGLAAAVPLLAIGFAAWRANVRNAVGDSPAGWLFVQGCAALLAIAALVVLVANMPDPRAHAYSATRFAIVLYAIVHSGLCAVLGFHALWRVKAGFISRRRALELSINGLWGSYTAFAGAVGLVAILVLQHLAALPGRG
jgi:cytochrome c oxidase subunit I+III